MPNFLLTLLYFVVLVPVGYVARWVRDPLARDRRADVASYWIHTDAPRAALAAGPTENERTR
jgi:hypothetical protein